MSQNRKRSSLGHDVPVAVEPGVEVSVPHVAVVLDRPCHERLGQLPDLKRKQPDGDASRPRAELSSGAAGRRPLELGLPAHPKLGPPRGADERARGGRLAELVRHDLAGQIRVDLGPQTVAI